MLGIPAFQLQKHLRFRPPTSLNGTVAYKELIQKRNLGRHHTHLDTRRWAATRRVVFERDGWRCAMCGRAGRLECDHIRPLEREPGQDPYDMNGLQTLCRGCHIAKTAAENRREPTPAEAAWRGLVAELLAD